MEKIKKTALYNNHLNLNAKMVEFAGFKMPIQYSSITIEHTTVRNNVGIFDVSHMGEILIEGLEAEKLVQKIFTNDVEIQKDNQILYGMMLYDNGYVVDDLLVYKYNINKFLLVVNASNIEKNFAWINENNSFDTTVKNVSNKYSEIAIQGPQAEAVLQKLTKYDLSKIKFFTFAQNVEINNQNCIVSRTGYTGEDGFEIYGEELQTIWEKLIELGASPIGLGARDTLRFEVALPLYGHEISDEISPIEAGLGMFVKMNKNFIGKAATVRIKENRQRKIVGLKLLSRGIARSGYKVFDETKTEIGYITTGYKLDEDAIALAFVPMHFKLDDTVQIQIRTNYIPAKIISKKFINKNYKK